MEPRHPGGSSSLQQGPRNRLASSWRVGSCGRSGLRRRRNSRGGPAGGAGSFGASTRGELSDAQQTFRSLDKELAEVELEGRKRWVLRPDRSRLEHAVPLETVRLLPAGDPYLASADRALLVPQPRFRSELWPKSVWPVALLMTGELVGTWRRQVS